MRLHKLLSTLFALLCGAFVVFCLVQRAPAQQQVSGCIQVVTNGALTCAPWSLALLHSLTNSVVQVKGAPGIFGGFWCSNPNVTTTFLQVFDMATAGAVSLSSTLPKMALAITSDTAEGEGPSSIGVEFLNGIQVAATTSATGGSAPSSAIDCTLFFN